MVNVIKLNSKAGAIRLVNDRGYCQIELDVDERETKELGGTPLEDIANSLLEFLEGAREESLNRHDDGFEWMSLHTTSDPMHFFFGRRNDYQWTIKIWNGEAVEKAGEIQLDPEEGAAWCYELRSYLPTLMRQKDFHHFRLAAKSNDLIIIVCGANAASGAYIGRADCRVRPPNLIAPTRKIAPNEGLVALDPGDMKLLNILEHMKPRRSYEEYAAEIQAQGFSISNEADGFVVRDASFNTFHGDYKLHGLYTSEGANAYTSKSGEAIRRDLNRRLGGDLIRTGPHDVWQYRNDRKVAGVLFGPQPPAIAFLPDGVALNLTDDSHMQQTYEWLGIDWDSIYPSAVIATNEQGDTR